MRRNEQALEGYREAMTCHLGDFEEYAALRRALKDREAELARTGAAQRRASAAAVAGGRSDRRRHPGAGRSHAGLAVVLDPGIVR